LTYRKTVPFSVLLAVLLTCLILSLIPILILGTCDVPFADDFSFSCETRAALQDGGSLIDVLSGALQKVRSVYMTWQGTFSGIFLMAFQPGIFGLRTYGLTPLLMSAMLLTGILTFSLRLFRDLFRLSGTVAWILGTAVCIYCVQLVPDPNQGLYWYNGAVYYTFTFGLTLLCYALWLRYVLKGGAAVLAVVSILAVIIGGSNFVTALETCILFFFGELIIFGKKNPRWKALLLPFLLACVSLAVSAAAPGNAVRQAEYPDSPNAFAAVLLSFRYAFLYILHSVTLPYAGFIVFLIPVLRTALPASGFIFRAPALFSLFSFCIFSSLFTPHIYSEGTIGPGRLTNIYFYCFILLTVINLCWWSGWAFRKRREKDPSPPPGRNSSGLPMWSFLLSSAVFLVCVLFSIVLHMSSYTSLMAIGELRNGEAKEYYRQAVLRQTVLEDHSVKDCVFTPYTVQPYLLYFGDMSSDPTDYTNQDASTFYGKDSIRVIPSEALFDMQGK